MPSPTAQKAIFFDLMGTCCDWLSSLLPVVVSCPPHPSLSPSPPPSLSTSTSLTTPQTTTPPMDPTKARSLLLSWRSNFFTEIQNRFERNEDPEDIDTTHRRVLDTLLTSLNIQYTDWDDTVRERLVQAWHMQTPWPDVLPALHRLRSTGSYFLVVLANGTTRLQLDITASANLPFHMLFSSQLLGHTKPSPQIYHRAMELVSVDVKNCYMVASHLYDVEAAKGVGMRTVYVRRETEDVGKDFERERVKGYVDFWGEGFGEVFDWLVGEEVAGELS
ncbi:HAD-like protein [Amniculicola lignicola CBS 123094]|uniref:HAD-like protein n=1 Tax=Amniculicola lignicola CBS 123094 TaxID=1392246 RepID=A0A6A5WYD5_9PLEO|nr:HAD-like protein [Amniculicola lignicola CBS 123094]